jgi:hypothetical protein
VPLRVDGGNALLLLLLVLLQVGIDGRDEHIEAGVGPGQEGGRERARERVFFLDVCTSTLTHTRWSSEVEINRSFRTCGSFQWHGGPPELAPGRDVNAAGGALILGQAKGLLDANTAKPVQTLGNYPSIVQNAKADWASELSVQRAL